MSRNILMIEDDDDARENLRDILELDGYSVTGAGTLREAMEGRAWADYAVILLDRQLPDGKADSILPMIQEIAPQAAVIVTTGLADMEGVLTALRSGAADYLLKPINADLLRAAVARAVKLQEVEQENKNLELRLLRGQRLESIGTLVGGIAHDLNNVLTPILMSIRLLQLDRNAADRPAILDMARTSVERGVGMIKQLLAFAGGVEGQKTRLELPTLVREVCSMLEHSLPKSIVLQTDVDQDVWPIVGDVTQLTQVLMNICVNARDAMPGGGTLILEAHNVTLTRPLIANPQNVSPGRYVMLSVADTGTGMPKDVVDRMFDPFYTTKELGRGTGLGLSTSLGIIRSHGGAVNVYSEPGRGTRIIVYLPASEAAAVPGAAAPATESPYGHGELVLVVDDEAPILATAKMLLEAHGYRVVTAANGMEAIEIFRTNKAIRAVLLDMMMPGMDGPTTMAALAQLDPTVRIIAASGLRASGAAAAAVSSRALAFLQKPYGDEQLLRTLAEAIKA